MISESKVILFATEGNNSTSHLPQGAPLWDHGNYFLATLTPSTISLSVELLPTKSNPAVCSSIPLDVFCVPTQDVSTSHSASGSCIARSSRRSILLESPSSLLVMLAGVLRTRRQYKDGDRINAHMKCNLDREDCTSLRFPFILLYA